LKQSNTSTNYGMLLNSFKNPEISKTLLKKINACQERITIMEVCGTHTVALFRTGIRNGLPENVNLVSGPGCPVCVTPLKTMEKAIGLAEKADSLLYCFGDMMKVPGVHENLESAVGNKGAHVRLMYSPIEALEFAKARPSKKVILFGVGFETTIPLFASILIRAKKDGVKNLFLLSDFKVIPPALDALASAADIKIDGFLLPGHVSAIIGSDAYGFMTKKYKMPGVIAGFESVDILEGILTLTNLILDKKALIKNDYARFVTPGGNRRALAAMAEVFEPADSTWRGIGEIGGSGLKLNKKFEHFDAEKMIDFVISNTDEPLGCMCGDVIKGKCKPPDCKLYKRSCSPSHPVGPCMVSSEGTCAAYYKYGGSK